MSRFYRAASMVVTSVCALAAMGALPAQQAIGAPLFAQPATEPLPPVPTFENNAEAGIAQDIPVDQIPAIEFPVRPAIRPTVQASSLTGMVSRFAGSTPGTAELDCLAKAVYFESKGEPLAGQLAVAQVVLNRSKSGRFASTVCGVVKQPSQFSFVRGGSFPAVVNQAMWRQAVGVAHVAINQLYEGPAQGALYFHAKRVSPNWGRQRVAAVGNHIFYR